MLGFGVTLALGALGHPVLRPPQVSLGEVRATVPAGLRVEGRDERALPYILKACGRTSFQSTEFDGLSDALAGGKKPSTPESARDLLLLWDSSRDAKLLGRSRRVLSFYAARSAALAKALTYPRWSFPRRSDRLVPKIDDVPATLFPEFAALKELTYVALLQAEVDLAGHRPENAERYLLMARSIGEHLAGAEQSLVAYLTGIAVESIADRQILRIARRGGLPLGSITRLARHLAKPTARKDLTGSLKGEFDAFPVHFVASFPNPKSSSKIPWSGGPELKSALEGHPNPFDRTATVKLFAEIFSLRAQNVLSPWGTQQNVYERVQKLVEPLPSWLREEDDESAHRPTADEVRSARKALRSIDNPVGLVLMASLSGVGEEETKAAFRSEARQLGTAVALAAIAYRRRTGAWPTSLDWLQPEDGTSGIVQDPFSARPFRYDAKRLVVWSDGAGGTAQDRKQLTFSLIPVPAK